MQVEKMQERGTFSNNKTFFKPHQFLRKIQIKRFVPYAEAFFSSV